MSDPQIWTLIGVVAASTFGLVGLTSTLFLQVLRSELAALEARMDARFEVLDRDIAAIARRVFPEDP